MSIRTLFIQELDQVTGGYHDPSPSPARVTTLALGEEGGSADPHFTTLAMGEDGNPPQPPVFVPVSSTKSA